ncbi:hypothetical protein F5888DRAFT_1776124 [Russula emetica]|nr:hypothetical protein F5888DRAFT_1776124 [Russula emetica]
MPALPCLGAQFYMPWGLGLVVRARSDKQCQLGLVWTRTPRWGDITQNLDVFQTKCHGDCTPPSSTRGWYGSTSVTSHISSHAHLVNMAPTSLSELPSEKRGIIRNGL